MFNIELFEAVFAALSFMFVAPSVYLWLRGEMLPFFPDQPPMVDWPSRCHALAGLSASFALFSLGLLMIAEVIEAITG